MSKTVEEMMAEAQAAADQAAAEASAGIGNTQPPNGGNGNDQTGTGGDPNPSGGAQVLPAQPSGSIDEQIEQVKRDFQLSAIQHAAKIDRLENRRTAQQKLETDAKAALAKLGLTDIESDGTDVVETPVATPAEDTAPPADTPSEPSETAPPALPDEHEEEPVPAPAAPAAPANRPPADPAVAALSGARRRSSGGRRRFRLSRGL